MSYQNPIGKWSLSLGVGNMDDDLGVLDDGIMFAIYGTGPWAGIKLSNDTNVGWLGMDNTQYDLMVREGFIYYH